MDLDYIIVTPVRNEEDYFEETVKSVLRQTIRPLEWIIVNDGSTDRTPEIINRYCDRHSWIRRIDLPVHEHSPGGGVVRAFYMGYNSISHASYGFIVKLDGDLAFAPDYFEYQLQEFSSNPKLGMTSGTTCNVVGEKLVMDRMPRDHVRGAAKMYRKACFDEIGGIQSVLGWDTLDELKAQMLGWETRSYRNLLLKHFKPIGFKQKNTIKRELTAGERLHFLGYHPLYAMLKCLHNLKRKPYFTGGALMIYGYLLAVIKGGDKNSDREMIRFYRKKQMRRLSVMIGLSKY